MRSYKSAVTFRINLMQRTEGKPVWQRNYYEHVIRDERQIRAICDYIKNNPLNWDEDIENKP